MLYFYTYCVVIDHIRARRVALAPDQNPSTFTQSSSNRILLSSQGTHLLVFCKWVLSSSVGSIKLQTHDQRIPESTTIWDCQTVLEQMFDSLHLDYKHQSPLLPPTCTNPIGYVPRGSRCSSILQAPGEVPHFAFSLPQIAYHWSLKDISKPYIMLCIT